MADLAKDVREFHERVKQMNQVADDLSAILFMGPESPFYTAMWKVMEGYRDTLEELYGLAGWVDWWWLECDMGNRPMQVKIPGDDEFRLISTIDDFVLLVVDDFERRKQA